MRSTLLSDDIEELLQYVVSNNIIKESDSELIAYLRSIHKFIYSLSFWDFKLNGLKGNRRIFLSALRSNALESMVLSLYGFNKAFYTSLRGIIENTLRHIYYYDHYIEFILLEEDKTNYVGMDELIKYAKLHPQLVTNNYCIECINELKSKHRILSKYLHERSSAHMKLVRSVKELIYFDNDMLDDFRKEIRETCRYANFLLMVFHEEKYDSFRYEERELLLNVMTERLKRKFHGL